MESSVESIPIGRWDSAFPSSLYDLCRTPVDYYSRINFRLDRTRSIRIRLSVAASLGLTSNTY